jgi:hypothetical protein
MSTTEQSPDKLTAPRDAKKRFIYLVRRNTIAVGAFFIALILAGLSHVVPQLPTWVTELLLAVAAGATVHLLDRLLFFKEVTEALDQINHAIVADISDTTATLIKTLGSNINLSLNNLLTSVRENVNSLQSLVRSGAVQLYATRDDAARDIHRDLTNSDNRKIRLIGISLNDFLLAPSGNALFRDAWARIRRLIENKERNSGDIDIRILIIDPTCLGAQLRSHGEARSNPLVLGRLNNDVTTVIKELLELEKICTQEHVLFQCKLYRLPPILALYLTDSVSYIQQYYFWSTREDAVPFPILKFTDSQPGAGKHAIHSQLEKHFDWIWDHASIGIKEYHDEYSFGFEKGVLQVGMKNVYTDPAEGRERMNQALLNAKHTVTLQGVSLHSFFNTKENTILFQAILRLIKDGKVDLELFFLDPESDQAVMRSYREYLFAQPSYKWEAYLGTNRALHRASTLYADTLASKDELKAMICDIAVEKNETDWQPKLKAGYYSWAPHCFLLRVDNAMFVEQYHYGKLSTGTRIILGKDMPLVEYINEPDKIFEPSRRTAFALLENHLEFIRGHADLFDIEAWLANRESRLPTGGHDEPGRVSLETA